MMSNKTALKPLAAKFGAAGCLIFAYGCASQQPAPQFTEASQTYEAAANGKAGEYAPDELLEAKKLLNEASEAKNGSAEQIHLAYLADRQARLATSSGTIEYYENQATEAQDQYVSALEQRSTSASEQLEETRRELGEIEQEMQKKDANVEELEARKAELESRKSELESKLSAKEAALTESEKARKDAEARAQAALASLNELAQVKEEANETVITLSGSVLFKTGESELLPIAETNLAKVADAIQKMDDEKQIVIEGHTDSRGAVDMNKDLSQKRAQSVMDFLASKGVDKSRMKAVGRGESEPVASNDSPEGRANNRRVELHISGGSDQGSKSASSNDSAKQSTSS